MRNHGLHHCRARPWEPGKYATKADQDAKLPLLLDWVRAYSTRTDDMSLAAHRRLFDSYTGPKRELTIGQLPSLQPAIVGLMLPMTTSRLVLRRFVESDAPAFLAYRDDPEIARYQSWAGCTAAAAAEFVRCHQAREFGVPGEWLQIAIAHQTTNEAGEAQDLPGK